MKYLLAILALIVVGYLDYRLGKCAELQNKNVIKERHVYAEPKIQYSLAGMLQEALLTLKTPYSRASLLNAVSALEKETNLENCISLASFSANNYRFLVADGYDQNNRNEDIFMVTPQGITYLKSVPVRYN